MLITYVKSKVSDGFGWPMELVVAQKAVWETSLRSLLIFNQQNHGPDAVAADPAC